MRELDYEGTLSALQAFLGTRVMVSLQDGTTEFVAATFVGPLRSAVEADLAKQVPELEGDLAGETMFFVVSEAPVDGKLPAAYGAFGIWRTGFMWGREVDGPHGGVTVSFEVGEIEIRVRAVPAGA